MGIKELLKKLEISKRAIAKERDKLRVIAEEAEELCESCDNAERDLDSAIDHLSEYV